MFGFDNIEEVTHQLENILDEHRREGIAFTAELVEIVLATLDYCQHALQSNNAPVPGNLLGRINNYKLSDGDAGAEAPTEVYCILFKPDKDVFERGINISAALKELQDLGILRVFDSESTGRSYSK
jgi:hypothetical protein